MVNTYLWASTKSFSPRLQSRFCDETGASTPLLLPAIPIIPHRTICRPLPYAPPHQLTGFVKLGDYWVVQEKDLTLLQSHYEVVELDSIHYYLCHGMMAR